MKKTNARNKFHEKALVLGMKQVAPFEEYLEANEEGLIQKFITCFESYCQQVTQMQKEGKKEPLAHIHFSLLRTNILDKNYKFRIDSYNKNWYMDKKTCSGEYDVSEIFSFISLYETALETERSKYAGQISASDVKSLLLEESMKYTDIITELIRLALKRAVQIPSYQSVLREEYFIIQVGEFRDISYTVYVEDRRAKNPKDIIRLLETKEEEHQYEIFEQIELEGGDFTDLRMAYSSGKGSHFTKNRFQRALMVSCEFQETTFKEVNFKDAQLLELDFTGAHLENINFEDAQLHYLNFENAKLINVDFTKVIDFEDINLSKATLINTKIPSESEVS